MQCFMRSLKVVYMVPAIEVHLAFQQVTGHPIGDDLCLQSAVESFLFFLRRLRMVGPRMADLHARADQSRRPRLFMDGLAALVGAGADAQAKRE